MLLPTRFVPACFALGLVFVAALVPSALAVKEIQFERVQNSPYEVRLESFLDGAIPSGFIPVQLTLRNPTDEPRIYTLEYENIGYSGERITVKGRRSFEVPARGRSQTNIYLPTASPFPPPLGRAHAGRSAYHGNTYMHIGLTGPGIKDGNTSLHLEAESSPGAARYGATSYVALGLGRRIAESMGRIKNKLPSGVGSSCTELVPATMTVDWRGYAGFDSVWLETREWEDLGPGARSSIIEWVGMGGRLFLVGNDISQSALLAIPGAIPDPDATAAPPIPALTPSGNPRPEIATEEMRRIFGLGRLTFVHHNLAARSDDEPFANYVAQKVSPPTPLPPQAQLSLPASIGEHGNSTIATLAFFLLFICLVGPVNFFLLAPGKRRHRILWTTPLISLAACAILFVAIIISDGTGGRGKRVTFACLLPSQKQLILVQEQVSRTGLLLGNNFDFTPDASLSYNETTAHRRSSRGGTFEQTPTGWAGDWFRSRAIQGQSIRAVRATHGGIRVNTQADGLPVSVTNSLELDIAELYYVPDGGDTAYRTTTRLAPGDEARLSPVPSNQYEHWWLIKNLNDGAPANLVEACRQVANRPGNFYARLNKPSDLAIPTLRSITWEDDTALVTGPAEIVKK